MSLYSEVSVKHLLHDGEQKCLKKFCVGGSDRKIGCSWSQFKDDYVNGIEYVSRRVEMYQTVWIEQDVVIINISNFRDLGIREITALTNHEI
ncbi:hypothetical protein AYI68_g4764 [Smittium mucronatum]|uniref:Uncharacterized protein n=1 Tax=Smittium mucronatum TaxID=133383 RepID=A0A1R0GW91_9FUNG|nr:hypothetical protein AYI68_g4764 [Smittium mucronatum]